MENLLVHRNVTSVAGSVVCVCVFVCVEIITVRKFSVLPSRPSRKSSMKINMLQELMVKVKVILP
jgi:hypothetical protein